MENAEEIASGIVEQLSSVDSTLSHKQLITISIYVADIMKTIVSMYTGNINPQWKLYCDVVEILKKKL